MLSVLVFAALLGNAAPQEPPEAHDPDPVLRLEDVVANPRTLREATEAFVDAVAAPARGRGIARWHEGVCVAAANLEPEVAQPLIDRVSDVARQLGLRAHEPECHPTILIVAAVDGDAFARDFVAMRPVLFRPGASGMDRGGAALERFVEAGAPVRWWTVSQPTDPDTGAAVSRMPGDVRGAAAPNGGGSSAEAYAPQTVVRTVSRLTSPYRQDIKRTFVIVDVDKLGGVTLAQLADYIAFVSLAQVDPEADTARYDTILNLFDSPGAVDGLTGWDTAYLRGLYESEWYRINQDSQVRAISHTITNEYRAADRATPAGE